MKSSTKLFVSVAFAAVLGVAPAFAQMRTTLKADVPFDFVVGGKLLPAGEYAIAEDPGSPAMIVRNESSEHSVIVLTNHSDKKPGSEDPALVFHLAGDRYYLAAVKTGSEAFDREAIKSKAQREAESASREPIVASIKAVRQ
jgi:hypothetical protein